jgi:hypothetical protein
LCAFPFSTVLLLSCLAPRTFSRAVRSIDDMGPQHYCTRETIHLWLVKRWLDLTFSQFLTFRLKSRQIHSNVWPVFRWKPFNMSR